MARHRDVRNLDADEFDDDFDSYGSSYGSSYVDELQLSTSVERDYMYRRGSGGGHTPKMGHFMGRRDSSDEEEAAGGRRIRARSDSETSSSSNSNPFDDLDPEDKRRMAACLEDILDIVGESVPEHVVKEAIVRCDFNKEVALNTLLNNPVGHGMSGGRQQRRRRVSPRPSVGAEPDEGASGSSVAAVAEPVPIRSSGAAEAVIKTSAAATGGALRKNNAYKNIPTVVTAAPAAVARLNPAEQQQDPRSRSQSPSVADQGGRGTPVGKAPTSSSSSTPQQRVQMRKSKLDPLEEYKKERCGGQNKDLLNLVVVGHVDSGKSTLMGHLLFTLGTVGSKVMHRYEQESKKVGKQSFAYAWVLDETSEERERGITMDVGQSRFETPSKAVTLLDAPGHKDFIPNMISGAYQADVAILVVNATRGEFEAGFEAGGQTREHALLVSSDPVGAEIRYTVDGSQQRFEEIAGKLRQFLRTVGFKESDVTYVPCSGFTGDNLAKASEKLSWHKGPTLLEAIDNFRYSID